MATKDALQILVNDEARPHQPGIAEDHREQPDDAPDARLIGELDLQPGEINLRLFAGQRLEASFVSRAAGGTEIADDFSTFRLRH